MNLVEPFPHPLQLMPRELVVTSLGRIDDAQFAVVKSQILLAGSIEAAIGRFPIAVAVAAFAGRELEIAVDSLERNFERTVLARRLFPVRKIESVVSSGSAANAA